MKRNLSLACLGAGLSLAMGTMAGAATYSYVGQPFQDCGKGWCMAEPGSYWSGGFWVNEARLPKGILLNATISLRNSECSFDNEICFDDLPWGGDEFRWSETTISSAAGSFSEVHVAPGWYSTVVSIFGHMEIFLDGPRHNGDFDARTDERGRIVKWSGGNMDGGENDAFHNSWYSYDGYDDGTGTLGPGRWTGGPDRVAPAPVPLPASLAFMATAIGALGIARWRRAA